jgi:hypothetical protein
VRVPDGAGCVTGFVTGFGAAGVAASAESRGEVEADGTEATAAGEFVAATGAEPLAIAESAGGPATDTACSGLLDSAAGDSTAVLRAGAEQAQTSTIGNAMTMAKAFAGRRRACIVSLCQAERRRTSNRTGTMLA